MRILKAAVFVLCWFVAGASVAAINVTRAQLSGGSLRVEGSGAVANATVTVTGGSSIVSGRARSSGSFRIEASGYSSPSCLATVSDGTSSVQRTLSGCTPSQPPPAQGPAAPVVAAPANGTQLQQPITISWNAVMHPNGIIAYNWQVSDDSTFATIDLQGSTTNLQDRVDGLPTALYFWRVQAVSGGSNPQQGAFSAARTFSVMGLSPTAPATPVIGAPAHLAQFHPFEYFNVSWSAVSGAATYTFESDNEPSFTQPLVRSAGVTATSLRQGFAAQGSNYFRVRALGADGSLGLFSAPIRVDITYSAPIPPPPNPVSPADGATRTLPITFDWTDVPNPQPGGYELQIDDQPTFNGDCGSIEQCVRQITASQYSVTSLSAGAKYWRVRSIQGNASPTAGAATAWSAVRSFTVPGSASVLSAYSLIIYHNGQTATGGNRVYSGTTGWNRVFGSVQLSTPAPAGGAVIALGSANPGVASIPASATIQAGQANASFAIQPQQVIADTPVNLSASYAGTTVSTTLVVTPSSLNSIKVPFVTGGGHFPGGVSVIGDMVLNGLPPAEGALIALTSSNAAAAAAPATITALSPQWVPSFQVTTSQVSAVTPVTVTASWRGASVSNTFTVYPPPALTAPANGTTFSAGQLVRLTWGGQPFDYDVQIDDSSAFTAPLIVDTNASVASYESATLPSGALSWRVRAVDVFGNKGPWSATRSFTVR